MEHNVHRLTLHSPALGYCRDAPPGLLTPISFSRFSTPKVAGNPIVLQPFTPP